MVRSLQSHCTVLNTGSSELHRSQSQVSRFHQKHQILTVACREGSGFFYAALRPQTALIDGKQGTHSTDQGSREWIRAEMKGRFENDFLGPHYPRAEQITHRKHLHLCPLSVGAGCLTLHALNIRLKQEAAFVRVSVSLPGAPHFWNSPPPSKRTSPSAPRNELSVFPLSQGEGG